MGFLLGVVDFKGECCVRLVKAIDHGVYDWHWCWVSGQFPDWPSPVPNHGKHTHICNTRCPPWKFPNIGCSCSCVGKYTSTKQPNTTDFFSGWNSISCLGSKRNSNFEPGWGKHKAHTGYRSAATASATWNRDTRSFGINARWTNLTPSSGTRHHQPQPGMVGGNQRSLGIKRFFQAQIISVRPFV